MEPQQEQNRKISGHNVIAHMPFFFRTLICPFPRGKPLWIRVGAPVVDMLVAADDFSAQQTNIKKALAIKYPDWRGEIEAMTECPESSADISTPAVGETYVWITGPSCPGVVVELINADWIIH